MKNKKNFIKTSDEKTAAILRESGLLELAKEGDKWVFVNNNENVNFSADIKDVMITNILHF